MYLKIQTHFVVILMVLNNVYEDKQREKEIR